MNTKNIDMQISMSGPNSQFITINSFIKSDLLCNQIFVSQQKIGIEKSEKKLLLKNEIRLISTKRCKIQLHNYCYLRSLRGRKHFTRTIPVIIMIMFFLLKWTTIQFKSICCSFL